MIDTIMLCITIVALLCSLYLGFRNYSLMSIMGFNESPVEILQTLIIILLIILSSLRIGGVF